jgi:hypothetical protein
MTKQKPKTDQKSLIKLEELLEVYFGEKAPALPEGIREFIVNFGPWITLLMVIAALPVMLAVLGLGTAAIPFSYLGGFQFGLRHTLSMFLVGATLVLDTVALPGLFKRKLTAWRLIFYVSLISAAQNALTMNFSGLIIGSLISWYVLFQIKKLYR